MAKSFATARFDLGLATWAEEATNPNAGAGTPAAVGSWWQQQGAYPAVPTTLQLKVGAGDKGWLKQNLVNLNVFNVKDPAYGAVGDGVTDDGPAIQAAVNAANAAGGGVVYFPPVAAGLFYRLRKPAVNLGSVMLDNVHNVTLLGDGFASKVEMFDDSGAAEWNGFQIQNGSTNVLVDNLQIAGDGITNAAATFLNRGVDVHGQAADANVGISRIGVTGCWWGAFPGDANGASARLLVTGDDAAHVVTNIRYERNMGTGTASRNVQVESHVDKVFLENNYVDGAANTGLRCNLLAATAGNTYQITGNQVTGATPNGTLSTSRGDVMWNVINSGSRLSLQTGASDSTRRQSARGNVATVDTTALAVIDGSNCTAPNTRIEIVGNVCISLGAVSTRLAISAGGAGTDGVLIADNVVLSNSSGAQSTIAGANTPTDLLIAGNIVLRTNAGSGSGDGITPSNFNNGFHIVGNLVMGINGDTPSTSVNVSTSAGFNQQNTSIVWNLLGRRILWFINGGVFQQWRCLNDNNIVDAVTANTLPVANVGVTQEGPAGPGAQIALNNATPVANVSAPTGSLCANTSGGQATTISYKESGAGVSGGTAGWLGIGAAELVFGALAGSLATANRFFAPGGLGLAAESATEIQAAATRAGQLRNLRARMVAGTGGGTNTYTVRKNAVDTTIVTGVANTGTNNSDLTHAATVVKGDLISIRVSKSLAPTTPQTNIVLGLEIV